MLSKNEILAQNPGKDTRLGAEWSYLIAYVAFSSLSEILRTNALFNETLAKSHYLYLN